MDESLKKELFFPLLIVFVISVIFHWCLEWDGFFLNLSTELIGIVVTVGYVDHILKKHEARKWRIPRSRVNHRLKQFVDRSINDYLYSLQ